MLGPIARRHRAVRFLSWAVVAVGLLLCPAPSRAQADSSTAPTLHVLTFGPGDHPFTKFGHDALWVHDPQAPPRRRDLVFNYGTFRFDSPWLIIDFLKGNLAYWLSISTLDRTLASYRAANRAIRAQRLDVSATTARSIVQALYENARPENKYYRYDYFADNCATRIRDLLDKHLDHSLKANSTGPANLGFRAHTRRLTQDTPSLFFAIDFILGPAVDRPVSQWEEMFLPTGLETTLSQIKQFRGPTPLVGANQDLLTSDRPPEPQTVPSSIPWFLGGLSLGLLFGWLGVAYRRRWARIAVGASMAVFSLLAGLMGLGLWILCLYTDHDVTYWNQNVLVSPVWALLGVGIARDWLRPKLSNPRFALYSSASIAMPAVGVWLLQPWLPQYSEPALGVFLPVWLGIVLAVAVRTGAETEGSFSPFSRYFSKKRGPVESQPGHH